MDHEEALKRLQKREIQRNQLFETLRRIIIRREEEGDKKRMMVALMLFCQKYLLPKGREQIRDAQPSATGIEQEYNFLETEIAPTIKNFSPNVQEERCVLYALLLEWAAKSFCQDTHGNFLTLTIHKCEAFLNTISLIHACGENCDCEEE